MFFVMKRYYALLIMLLLALSACSRSDASAVEPSGTLEVTAAVTPALVAPTSMPEYEFSAASEIFVEKRGDKKYTAKGDTTATERVVYFFENGVTEAERLECIRITEALFDACQPTEQVKVCILDEKTYASVYIKEGTLYTSNREWNAAEYMTELLLTCYGQYCNYGLCYGYANQLCRELGFSYIVQESAPKLSERALYDMNLLCFDEQYVSAEEAAEVRKLAAYFAEQYINQHGVEQYLQLVQASGSVETAARVGEELQNILGITVEYSPILYSFGGITHEYLITCEYANFFLRKDWVDAKQDVNPALTDNFLHESYPAIKAFFEINRMQMGQYNELFPLERYDKVLEIVFINEITSFYQMGRHEIHLNNIDSLMHEYIHSLTLWHVGSELWEKEGLARYFSYKYDAYGLAYTNYLLNLQETSEENDFVKEYLSKQGRAYDAQKDGYALEGINAYVHGVTHPSHDYAAACSFIHYLVQTYGEERTIRYVCWKKGTQEDLGKSFDELVSDWNAYLKENYSDYTKYD